MSLTPLRIVVAEDATLLREGLVELLGRFGHQVIAAVGDATSLLAAVAEGRPDVVITDVRMPPGFGDEGIEAAMELRSRQPDLGILVLSQYAATTYAIELLERGSLADGGLGYLLKERVGDVSEFVDSVVRIAGGEVVIDQEVVRQLLGRRRTEQPLERLTAREREVLGRMAAGRTNAGIADDLYITQAAVAKHIGNVFAKLDLAAEDGHRRVLAVLAYLRGLPGGHPSGS